MSIAKGSPNHKHAGGRPLKYTTLLELETIVQAYFRECDPHKERKLVQQEITLKNGSKSWQIVEREVLTEQEPYTMAGLARRLGMARSTLMEYKAKDEFSDAIKEARSIVEEYNERRLHTGTNVAGSIFNLKVNFGYREIPEENAPPENPIVFINNVPITPGDSAATT